MKKLTTVMMVTLTLMFGTSKLFSQTTDYVQGKIHGVDLLLKCVT